jgi:uncharacterized membrane protein
VITSIQHAIDVDVPVRVAYNQWTQFEDFPQFMDSVIEVEQLTADTTRWVTEVNGVKREFVAEITEQTPDQRVAWGTVEGPRLGGVVTFHELDDGTTRVMYQMDFEPSGLVESAGAATGVVKRTVTDDLERFKKFIEARDEPTGAWRGEIEGDL